VLVRVFRVLRGEHTLLATTRSGSTGQWSLSVRVGRSKVVKAYAMVGTVRTRTTTMVIERAGRR
jgi:hypothetical protein